MFADKVSKLPHLPRPKCSENSDAHPLIPPLLFMKVLNGTRGFLNLATNRRARDYLLMVLLSRAYAQVQRMTTAKGSELKSTGSTPANLNARRTSFRVLRRRLQCFTIENTALKYP